MGLLSTAYIRVLFLYPLYLLTGAFSQLTFNIIIDIYDTYGVSLVAQTVKNLPAMQET